MRTRNKQAKDQTNNKRPKRGTDASDTGSTGDGTKTPNKGDKRSKPSAKSETPNKGKKRPNIDIDGDNEASDEKEKRKRCDVSVSCWHNISNYWISIYFLFLIFQSPTESMNSDSRPESVIDEQENTSEPPEVPLRFDINNNQMYRWFKKSFDHSIA